MGMQIKDGTGSGVLAGVSSDKRLNVSSKAEDRIFYAARDNGKAFSVHSIDSAAAAAEYTLYFKNDSGTEKFHVKDFVLSAGVLTVFKVSTVTGTAAGVTALTPFNLNIQGGHVALATSRGDGAVTGLTEATNFFSIAVAADETVQYDFHGALILSKDDAIAVECDVTAGGSVNIYMSGWYE